MYQSLFTGLAKALNFGIKVAMAIGVAALAFITASMTADVILRYVFNSPTTWISEISSFLMVVMVMMGLGYVQKKKAHIRVNLFLPKLSKKIQRWTTLIIYVFSLVFTIILAYITWREVVLSVKLRSDSTSVNAFPIAPWQVFIPLGLVILALTLIWDIGTEVARIRRGEWESKEIEEASY